MVKGDVDSLMKMLNNHNFILSNEISELSIAVYKSADHSDLHKLTHVIIGFGNEIIEVRCYKTELD